jgi:hypothetical protein
MMIILASLNSRKTRWMNQVEEDDALIEASNIRKLQAAEVEIERDWWFH